MSLTMTTDEREKFLADVHVGVISISEGGRGPLTVPVWYAYEPRGELRLITGRTSRKGRLLERAGRFSLCAQSESSPYRYVSVEGPIVGIAPVDIERDLRAMAQRYLGIAGGDRYMDSVRDDPSYADSVVVRMRPERWLTADYSQQG